MRATIKQVLDLRNDQDNGLAHLEQVHALQGQAVSLHQDFEPKVALDAISKAVELARTVVAQSPDDTDALLALAQSLRTHASYMIPDDIRTAQAESQEALAISRRSVKESPNQARY